MVKRPHSGREPENPSQAGPPQTSIFPRWQRLMSQDTCRQLKVVGTSLLSLPCSLGSHSDLLDAVSLTREVHPPFISHQVPLGNFWPYPQELSNSALLQDQFCQINSQDEKAFPPSCLDKDNPEASFLCLPLFLRKVAVYSRLCCELPF